MSSTTEKKAMAWKVIDSFLLSLMLLIGSMVAASLNAFQVTFIVNVIAAILAIVLFSRLRWERIKPNFYRLHLVRGLLGVISTSCILMAMQHMHFATVTAINFLAPVITSFASSYFFKEKIKITNLIALLLSLVGVVLILFPSFSSSSSGDFGKGVVFSLISVTCLVLYNINLKVIGEKDKVLAQMVFGPLFSALILLPFMGEVWKPVGLNVMYLLGAYGTLLMVKLAVRYWAFRSGKLINIMPIEYSQLLFSGMLGYFLLNQTLGGREVIGMVVIFLSSLVSFIGVGMKRKG